MSWRPPIARAVTLALLAAAALAAPARVDGGEWEHAWARVDGVAVLRTAVAADVARGAPLPHAIQRHVTLTLMRVNLVREGVDPAALSPDELKAALDEARAALQAAGRPLEEVLAKLGQSPAEFAESLRVPAAFRRHVRAGIDEAALRALHEQEALRLAGQVRARHVLVAIGPDRDAAAARARAEALLARLGEAPDEAAFAALVAESDDPMASLTGGDLDWFGYGPGRSVPPAVVQAAFARGRPGLVAEPVRSAEGLHLVWVTDTRLRASADFEALRPRLEALLEQRRAGEVLAAWRERTRVEYAPDAPDAPDAPAPGTPRTGAPRTGPPGPGSAGPGDPAD